MTTSVRHAPDSQLTARPFLFASGGVALAARMYRESDDLFVRQPALIVTGSWLAVKELMAHHYATALATRGYTAFTFDFAGYGGSVAARGRPRSRPARSSTSPRPRGMCRPCRSCAPGGVGYLAICVSARYTLAAIAASAPITSFVSVAGWYHDTASVAPFHGGPDGVRLRIDRSREALDAFLSTGEVRMVPASERSTTGSPARPSWSGPTADKPTSTTDPARSRSPSRPPTSTSGGCRHHD